MKVIHIEQDDQGMITVAMDDGEPQPVQSAEDACQIVEATFGQGGEGEGGEMSEGAFQGGFAGTRGVGL